MRLDHSSKARIEYNFRQCVQIIASRSRPTNAKWENEYEQSNVMFKNSIYIISSNNQTLSYST